MTEELKREKHKIALDLRKECVPTKGEVYRHSGTNRYYLKTKLSGGPTAYDPTGEIGEIELWWEVKQPAVGFLLLASEEVET